MKCHNKNVGTIFIMKCHNKNVGTIFIMKCHNKNVGTMKCHNKSTCANFLCRNKNVRGYFYNEMS